MNDYKRLGTNIRSLRKAFGETQDDLSAAIHVEKTTISNYENSIREPDKDKLDAIAKHFMVSIEELLLGDFSLMGNFSYDANLFWKHIDTIFPIVSTSKALENQDFKIAFDAHNSFYNELRSLEKFDGPKMDICFDHYYDALQDNDIKAEAAANYLALWYLLLTQIKTAPALLIIRPAPLQQFIEKSKVPERILDKRESKFKTDARTCLEIINNSELEQFASLLLPIVKESAQWSDLAYYYLALQYILCLVDNGVDWNINKSIGAEMIEAFGSVGNEYALQLIKISSELIKE